MRSRLLLPALIAATFASACGPPGAKPEDAASGRTSDGASAFDEREDEILRDLAAIDRRIALRARLTPSEQDLRRVTMAAVLREDPTVAIVDGAIDPFSFDARARGLEAARQKIAALPPVAQSRTSERELLGRLVDEESVRLEEERALPRSASSLVRAIIDTWQAPRSRQDALDADRWLTRRLASLRESMTAPNAPTNALDVVRARELDDALDALEHLASAPGFTTATQELVRVREALEVAASKPAAKAESEWDSIARRARAHLGLTAPPEDIARRLATVEADLRARVEKAVDAAKLGRDTLASSLNRHVFAAGPCVDAIPGSRVRSMAAPQEREAACHLRHFVARSDDGAEQALALLAMHAHVVVAQWAVDVARGTSTIADAQARHRLFLPLLPDARARYERMALARPITTIGAGEAVDILLSGDPKARASTWSTLGDVPLDIARRELGTAGGAR